MRLLLLTPEYLGSGGGIITLYRNLIPALVRAGVEVHVIEGSAVHSAPEASAHMRDGVHVQTLEHARLERWYARFSRFEAVPSLRRHIAASWALWEQSGFGEKFDVVEATDWGLLFLAPVIQAVRPVVVQCHGSIGQIAAHDPVMGEGTQDALVQMIERAGLSMADAVQSYSESNAAFWSREAGRPVSCIRPAWTLRNQGPYGGSLSRGLVTGRIQRWKGPHLLCEALRMKSLDALRIDWIGRDTSWGSRETSASGYLAKTYPDVWGRSLTPLPPMPPEEIARRQASALFNLVPSTWDVFNFTAVEAMASGRPTIVSTGAGAAELIEDGVNGLTFRAGDSNALAASLERVSQLSPSRQFEIGRNGRETIRTALDADKIAEIRIGEYRSVARTHSEKPRTPVSPWFNEMLTPGENHERPMSFLDHHPLRSILSYAMSRSGRKAAGRAGKAWAWIP